MRLDLRTTLGCYLLLAVVVAGGAVVPLMNNDSAHHAGIALHMVQSGDWIRLDVPNRRLELEISDAELEARRQAWSPPPPHHERGYGRLYIESVDQADKGADFRFLAGSSGTPKSKVSF